MRKISLLLRRTCNFIFLPLLLLLLLPYYNIIRWCRRVEIQPIVFMLLVLLYCVPSAWPVCSLITGQNAVYWWISEDKTPGSVIDTLPVEGRTNDSGDKLKNIELRLVSGLHYFSLDTSSKQLKLIKAVDREAGETKLDAVVECRSLVPNDNFRVNITVQVKVQDVNDNAPIFEHSDYFMNITEELPVGTLVFSGLKANDFDLVGPNSEILYSIVDDGQNSDLLSIPNPWDGNIVINKRIDYEELTNFTVTILAKDNGVPSLSSTAKLHIGVQDVDDQNPRFLYERYSVTLNADAPLGSLLEVFPEPIAAHDMDTLSAPMVYSLSGTDSDKFEIDVIKGKISLKQPVQGGQNYLLTVHAAQADRPERQAAAALLIRITGNNNGKPRFTSQSYVVQVLESVPVNSQLLRLTAVDSDQESDQNAVLLYSLKDAQKHPQFQLDRDNGVLKLAAQLDYETKQNHTLVVAVTDGKQSSEATIHVIVEDVNDNSPEFEQKDYYFKAISNKKGTLLGLVKAVDGDTLDHVSYSLLNFNDLFDVDDFGAIRIRNETKVTNRSYELVIAATDSGIPPRMGHATIRVDFGEVSGVLNPVVLSATTESASGSLILIIALAAVLGVLGIGCICLLVYVFKIRKRKIRRKPQIQPSRNQIIIANPDSALPKTNGTLRSRYAEKLISPITPSSVFLSEPVFNGDHRLNDSHSPAFRDRRADSGISMNDKRLSTFVGSSRGLTVADYCVPQGFLKHNHVNLTTDRESLDLSQDEENGIDNGSAGVNPLNFGPPQPPCLTVYF